MVDWKLKTRSQLPIGLDIGHSYIKMIQLAINGGHVGIVAAAKAWRISGARQTTSATIVSSVNWVGLGGQASQGRPAAAACANCREPLTAGGSGSPSALAHLEADPDAGHRRH